MQPEGAGAVIRAGCRRRASGTVAACRSRTKGAEISPNNKSGLHPLLHDGCPYSIRDRIGSAAEGPAAGNQPNDLATRSCSGNHVVARTSRRAPGGDGTGSDSPLSVQRPGRRARRPASARPARGRSPVGFPVSQHCEVSLPPRHEVLVGARAEGRGSRVRGVGQQASGMHRRLRRLPSGGMWRSRRLPRMAGGGDGPGCRDGPGPGCRVHRPDRDPARPVRNRG